MALSTAKTTYGSVRGRPAGNPRHSVFLGIPFAKPPVGELRFAPPQKPDAWNEELLCVKYSPDCIRQLRSGDDPFSISEDCLYLNVFTPACSPEEKLPVLFVTYGGGFNSSRASNPEFDGEAFNKEGAIVVTFNYRCGPLGFFALPELQEKHGRCINLGILDQLTALRWVWENIAGFGGDPNGEGLPHWPLYTAETPLTMHFADDHVASEDIILNDDERKVLEHTILPPPEC